jgi:hypothetical protein
MFIAQTVVNKTIIIFLVILAISSDWNLNSCYAANNNQSSKFYVKNTLKCNPQSRHLFGMFIMQCWSNARKEVGLSDPFILKKETSEEDRFNFKMAVEMVVLKIFNYNTCKLI